MNSFKSELICLVGGFAEASVLLDSHVLFQPTVIGRTSANHTGQFAGSTGHSCSITFSNNYEDGGSDVVLIDRNTINLSQPLHLFEKRFCGMKNLQVKLLLNTQSQEKADWITDVSIEVDVYSVQWFPVNPHFSRSPLALFLRLETTSCCACTTHERYQWNIHLLHHCNKMLDLLLVCLALLACCSAQTTNNVTNAVVATNVGKWTLTGAPVQDWYQLTASDSGQYMHAIVGSTITSSKAFGVEWFQSPAPSLNYATITTNSCGQRVYAVYNYNGSRPSLYISDDFGDTWAVQPSLPGQTSVLSAACSSSGEVVYLVWNAIDIWYSTDFGDSWDNTLDSTLTEQTFKQVVTDSSGKYAVTVSANNGRTNGAVYVSSDYGQTWDALGLNNGVNYYTGVQMSADGQSIIVVDGRVHGGVYLSTNLGADIS
jgi:hypothetical protein